MNMMSRCDWVLYAAIRNALGKKEADDFKRKRRKDAAKLNRRVNDNGFRICFQNGCDGYCEKRFYDIRLTDEDKADIENDIRIERPYSAYDCTGNAFTSWISFFDVPGGTWCYHSIAFDF